MATKMTESPFLPVALQTQKLTFLWIHVFDFKVAFFLLMFEFGWTTKQGELPFCSDTVTEDSVLLLKSRQTLLFLPRILACRTARESEHGALAEPWKATVLPSFFLNHAFNMQSEWKSDVCPIYPLTTEVSRWLETALCSVSPSPGDVIVY